MSSFRFLRPTNARDRNYTMNRNCFRYEQQKKNDILLLFFSTDGELPVAAIDIHCSLSLLLLRTIYENKLDGPANSRFQI